jgi:predicted DNA-binding transcriptional regulator AlpA
MSRRNSIHDLEERKTIHGESNPATEPFITVKQLAERLQVKTSTIWEWTRRRNTNPIPHFSVSRKVVYFRWSEVVRWIEGQRQAA